MGEKVAKERFAVWMRPNGLPAAVKKYGELSKSFKAGDRIHINITERFPLPGARKQLVFSNINTLVQGSYFKVDLRWTLGTALAKVLLYAAGGCLALSLML